MPSNLEPVATTTPAAPRRRRRRTAVAVLAAAAVVTGGSVAVASAHKTVELDVDGVEHTVSTFAGSVQGLLAEQAVIVGQHDAVGPGPDAALDDGMLVVVRSARQIRVDVDGEQRALWTTAETTGDAIQSFGEPGQQITLAASRSLDGSRQALDMPLVDGAPVDVVVDGQTLRVTPDGPTHLQDVLDLAGVTLGKLDDVVVGTGPDGVVTVTVTRNDHALRTDTEAIPYETTERADDSRYVGENRVVQEGVEGQRVRASLAVQHGEGETVGDASGFVTVTEPVAEIIAVGTKPRPAPEPVAPAPARAPAAPAPAPAAAASAPAPAPAPAAPAPAPAAAASAPAPARAPAAPAPEAPAAIPAPAAPAPAPAAAAPASSAGVAAEPGASGRSGGSSSSGGGFVSGDVWAALAQCESGGNPTIVSPNGLYHGLYQFSVATWQSVGGSGLPSQASPAEQTQRAQALQARSGWGQWPACSAKLGLR